MTVRYVRPVSHSAYAARRIALAALLLFALAALGHRFGPLRTPDFLALLLLSAAIAATAVPLAILGLARLWQKGAEGGMASAKALVYAAVPLAVVATAGLAYWRQPPLYEVSTDLEDAPPFLSNPEYDQDWLVGRRPVTVADRQAQLEAYPGLTGRRYEGALDRVLQGVEAAALSSRVVLLERSGDELLESTEPEEADEGDIALPENVPVPLERPGPRPQIDALSVGAEIGPAEDLLIQGETSTFLLGLPFDLVVRLREEEETTSVDMRVVSRYGAHDLGLSTQIAEDFLDRLDAELLGIAGG